MTEQQLVHLDIGGMTCASCAARVEKRLNRLEGVHASVNLATERAAVAYGPEQTTADLVRAVEATGYTAALHDPAQPAPATKRNADTDPTAWWTRVVVSAALSVPVVALAMVAPLQFRGWQWVSLALATPVVSWAAWPFHRAAWANARHRATTMDTLISVGVLAAFGWSLYSLVFGDAGSADADMAFSFWPGRGGADEIYLEVAAGVTTLILVGRYLESRARRDAGGALRAMWELGAKDVTLAVAGPEGPVEQRVPIEALGVGDEFVVRPGEKVASDGVVVSGSSSIDASMITGESLPIDVGPGDALIGATVNGAGRLVVRASRVGSDTALARLTRLVETAQTGKAAAQRLADRVSAVFVPVVIAVAAATLAGWLLSGAALGQALAPAVAVLIAACPCALGLATPTALMAGTGRGAQLGIVIRGPEVLESTRRVDTIMLDKTGTVTTGQLQVVDAWVVRGGSLARLWGVAGAVEAASEHPIARAVVEAARAQVVRLPHVEDFENVPGLGARGSIGSERVLVGRSSHALAPPTALPSDLRDRAAAAEAAGASTVWVSSDGALLGVIAVSDEVTPQAREAVERLRRLGLRPHLLTGDNAGSAAHVAEQIGLRADEVTSGVLPEGKVAAIRELQAAGRVVAMVGDGVNDAAALAQADLGLSMGTGTDAAIEAGDLTLIGSDLRAAADAIELSRATLRTIQLNLFWAFAYNTAAVPLAAFGLLSPLLAGAAMAFSSLFVVTNSLRLRRFHAA